MEKSKDKAQITNKGKEKISKALVGDETSNIFMQQLIQKESDSFEPGQYFNQLDPSITLIKRLTINYYSVQFIC